MTLNIKQETKFAAAFRQEGLCIHGYILHSFGEAAAEEVYFNGPLTEDVELLPPTEPGIWIWEGLIEQYHTCYCDTCDCEPTLTGEWRRATGDELACIAEGENPFE